MLREPWAGAAQVAFYFPHAMGGIAAGLRRLRTARRAATFTAPDSIKPFASTSRGCRSSSHGQIEGQHAMEVAKGEHVIPGKTRRAEHAQHVLNNNPLRIHAPAPTQSIAACHWDCERTAQAWTGFFFRCRPASAPTAPGPHPKSRATPNGSQCERQTRVAEIDAPRRWPAGESSANTLRRTRDWQQGVEHAQARRVGNAYPATHRSRGRKQSRSARCAIHNGVLLVDAFGRVRKNRSASTAEVFEQPSHARLVGLRLRACRGSSAWAGRPSARRHRRRSNAGVNSLLTNRELEAGVVANARQRRAHGLVEVDVGGALADDVALVRLRQQIGAHIGAAAARKPLEPQQATTRSHHRIGQRDGLRDAIGRV